MTYPEIMQQVEQYMSEFMTGMHSLEPTYAALAWIGAFVLLATGVVVGFQLLLTFVDVACMLVQLGFGMFLGMVRRSFRLTRSSAKSLWQRIRR